MTRKESQEVIQIATFLQLPSRDISSTEIGGDSEQILEFKMKINNKIVFFNQYTSRFDKSWDWLMIPIKRIFSDSIYYNENGLIDSIKKNDVSRAYNWVVKQVSL